MLNEPDAFEPPVFSCPNCGDQDHFQLIKNSYKSLNHVRRYLWHIRCACCGWNNHKTNLAQHIDREEGDQTP